MCPSKDGGVYYCCNAAAVKNLMLLLLLRLFIQGEGTVCVHLPACFPSLSVQCMDDCNPASQIHLELSGGGGTGRRDEDSNSARVQTHPIYFHHSVYK